MTKGKPTRSNGEAPLPTKEDILKFIEESPAKAGKREIARAFHLRGERRAALNALLKEMGEEGVLGRGHRQSLTRAGALPAVTVLEITGLDVDGEPLARPTGWKGEEPPPTILVLPAARGPEPGIGDRILARLKKLEDGRYEARIMKRLEATPGEILGVFQKMGADGRILPTEKGDRREYVVRRDDSLNAVSGELVLARPVTERGAERRPRRAEVLERLGPADAPKAVSLIAIHRYGLPHDFPEDVLAEASTAKPSGRDGRTDLRDLPFITIDPWDARDRDDALFAAPDDDARNPGGWRIAVAIADVAHYVRPNSALDREARLRGNSVYFPDRVVPMLPEALSSDLCSLHENADRPVIVAHLRIDAQGQTLDHRFERAVIRSRASLTYRAVQAAAGGNPPAEAAVVTDNAILPLYGAFDALKRAWDEREPLELDLPEREIRLDDRGMVESIRTRERLPAHRLVEMFMVAANVAAAETLEKVKQPCMYRIHEAPAPDKVIALGDFLKSLDMSLPRGQVLLPHNFNQILRRASETPHAHVINELVLRTQAQAYYGPSSHGHFGLNLRRYCHFTSPIRRYADILVHRALVTGLDLGPDGLGAEDIARFADTADEISEAERRAMAAERDSVDRYLAAYMSDRIGAVLAGRISGVTRFGLFVALDESGADGLIPISSLEDDYYRHVERAHALIGDRSGRTYRLGDAVRIRLDEAVPLTGGLRFTLIEGGKTGPARARAAKGPDRGRTSVRKRRSARGPKAR